MFDYNKDLKITDRVWILEEEKWKACMNEFKKNADSIFICWFDETYEKLVTVFNINHLSIQNIFLARQANWHNAHHQNVIFIEHYPLAKKEEELFLKLNPENITIFSSLDEPIFKQFESEATNILIAQEDFDANESIEHPRITSVIKQAQEKIAANVNVEIAAHSQADWLIKNLLA